MSPAPTIFFLLLSLCLASSLVSGVVAGVSNSTTLTAYQLLESYDFPPGILPQGVVSYELDTYTGKFSVDFGEKCEFSIQGSYQLRYQSTITGVISKGRLSQLNGVSVKVLLFWVSIVEVTRSGDDLEFSVGLLSADFPVDNFDESPKCGCGMDCVNSLELDPEIEQRIAAA